jgi:paraquat-inducible protein B
MKAANPKLIGFFVVGAAFLVVSALVLFSSQDLFTPKRKFVAYFQQSVTGLNIGAPVRFRGIPVGEVINIDGVYDPQTGNMIPRVILEFRPETLENASVEEGEYTLFPLLLENGLRASLKSASLLTGQLYVAMDFHPGTPVRSLSRSKEEYPEMPTIDSGFDEALAKLSDLPIEEVLSRAGAALAAAQSVLEDPNIGSSLEALTIFLKDADESVVDLRHFMRSDVGATLAEVNKTLASTRESVSSLSTRATEETLPKFDLAMEQMAQTLALARQRLGRDDPLNHELLDALREAGAAARSMRALADYLEEHPEALLKGKNEQ